MSDDITSLFAGVDISAWNNVDVTLTNCRFTQNPAYVDSDGNMPVVFSVDLTNEDGATREDQLFSFGGNNFEIIDGGAAVKATNAKLEKTGGFSNGTKLQVLLNSLLEADADAVAARYEAVQVGPRHAAFWEGLSFHLVEIEVPNRRNPEKPYRQQTATAILAWGDTAAPVKAAPAKAKPVRPTKPVKAAAATSTFGLSAEDYEAVAKIAVASADFEAFQTAIYDDDIIVNEGVQEVADDDSAEGLFATLSA